MRNALILLLLVFIPVMVNAEIPGNSRALAGLTAVGVIFDVNVGNPQKLLLRLKLIEETVTGILKENVSADVVVAVRGGATHFMTRGEKYISAEDLSFKVQIQAQIKRLKELGYRLEQCAVAVRLLNVDPQDIIPEVPLVENGYISMVGYQNRGYAFVPMD